MALTNPVTLARHGVFVFWLVLGAAAPACAQSVLDGNVLTLDSVGIAAAQVTLLDANGRLRGATQTDSLGGFSIELLGIPDSLTVFLSVISVGFSSIERAPVQLRAAERVRVRVRMSPDAVPIAAVTIIARQQAASPTLADYYDKLEDTKRGLGYGLDRNVMVRYSGLELINALQLVPGVEGGRSMQPEGVTLTVPKMRGGCVPLTFLDRLAILPEQLAVIDPVELEGVLIYVGGEQMPSDYARMQAGAECGMILAYRVPPARRRNTLSVFGLLLILGAFAAFAASAGW